MRPPSYKLINKIEGLKNEEIDSEIPHFEIETEAKYAGYVVRQESQVDKFASLENKKIPEWFDYEKIKHLSNEARQKLIKIRPETIGQAARIDGVRPSDVSVLLIGLAAV